MNEQDRTDNLKAVIRAAMSGEWTEFNEVADAAGRLVGADRTEVHVLGQTWVKLVFTWGNKHMDLLLQAEFLAQDDRQETERRIANMVSAMQRRRGWMLSDTPACRS